MLANPFIILTYDKVIEIGERLDNKSLSDLVRTSKKASEICQSTLNLRKEKAKCELIEKLVGKWAICHKVTSRGFKVIRTKYVRVELKQKRLLILTHFKDLFGLFDNMNVVGSHSFKYVNTDDIIQLENSYNLLIEKGFKKINPGSIFAIDVDGQLRISVIEIKFQYREKLLGNLAKLDVVINGDETDQQLRYLLVKELYERDLVLKCI